MFVYAQQITAAVSVAENLSIRCVSLLYRHTEISKKNILDIQANKQKPLLKPHDSCWNNKKPKLVNNKPKHNNNNNNNSPRKKTNTHHQQEIRNRIENDNCVRLCWLVLGFNENLRFCSLAVFNYEKNLLLHFWSTDSSLVKPFLNGKSWKTWNLQAASSELFFLAILNHTTFSKLFVTFVKIFQLCKIFYGYLFIFACNLQ